MAVLRPMAYKARDHTQFAVVAAVLVYAQCVPADYPNADRSCRSSLWLVYGLSVSNFSSETMSTLCDSSFVFPSKSISLLLGYTVPVDMLVYVLNANAVLLFMVSSHVYNAPGVRQDRRRAADVARRAGLDREA